MTGSRFYEDFNPDGRCRSAPAVARNRDPIAKVLADWLPASGLVLEIASGTGEHVTDFAARFPALVWQPSDLHSDALSSIAAWIERAEPFNVRSPMVLDAAAPDWPIASADATLCINMVHISPWESALGLLDGAARLLGAGGPLILYGPWIIDNVETAPSNLSFDADLKARDPRWGLRSLAQFQAEAERRGLVFVERRDMPTNNVMLLFRRAAPGAA